MTANEEDPGRPDPSEPEPHPEPGNVAGPIAAPVTPGPLDADSTVLPLRFTGGLSQTRDAAGAANRSSTRTKIRRRSPRSAALVGTVQSAPAAPAAPAFPNPAAAWRR
jgi:hypothetical protein